MSVKVVRSDEHTPNNRVAAILYFKHGAYSNKVRDLLEKLTKELEKDGKGTMIEDAIVGDYNPSHGKPVWYIP